MALSWHRKSHDPPGGSQASPQLATSSGKGVVGGQSLAEQCSGQPEVGCGPALPPHPPQPLIWAGGPCQGSVASADLLDLGCGQTGTRDSQALPRPHWWTSRRVSQGRWRRRGWGAARGSVAGWTGQAVPYYPSKSLGSRTVCGLSHLPPPSALHLPSPPHWGWASSRAQFSKSGGSDAGSLWPPALLLSGCVVVNKWLSLSEPCSGEL